MALFNYFFCILGIFFCQVCMIYSACQERDDASGVISHKYTVRGASMYHKCWTLKNPESNIIFIQLININLHNKPTSSGALIIEFLSESKSYHVSSPSQLRNFTTTSSVVEIHFKVNSSHFNNGMITSFTLNFSQDCDRILTDLTGTLSSPRYPKVWKTVAQCIYKIRLRPGYLINITFYDARMSYSDNCDDAYIKVHDGDNQESPLIAELCGEVMSYLIISTSNNLWMKYKSRFLGSAFYANYSAVETVYDDCNGKNDFRCSNNTCVPRSEVCDGMKNCQNGADEIGCDPLVEKSTNIYGPEEVTEAYTESYKQTFETYFTEGNLETRTTAQQSRPTTTGSTELTKMDILKMEATEHLHRLEVIELQKRYEMDRIEFLKNFENERLKKMSQLHNLKIRLTKREISKENSEKD